jgi:class 3 adenylate cyclase/tetratricopeptide (TPR) repeat protein
VTILITDVEGSTALHTARGDEAARAILGKREELVRGHVAEHGGHEIKSLGDGFIVAFASARRAVSCAVAIQRECDETARADAGDAARIRIGLNSGEVMEKDGDMLGAAVNAASRIVAKADGGQILVAGVVKDLAGVVPDVSFANRGRFRLKGFPERWQLFEVVWKREQVPQVPAPVERAPLVGRDAERDAVLAAVTDAEAARGGLVLIGGEPGIGKTRLAEEVMIEAERRGFRTLAGHCVEMEGGAPYLPIVEILETAVKAVEPGALRSALGDAAPEVARVVPHLRRVFPDIPAPLELPPEQERRYLFNSIHDFLGRAAEARPQLLLLDDLHWADEATVLLLQHLAERLAGSRVLILGTYRDTDLDSTKPFARALEDFLRGRLAHRVRLRGLSVESVATMLKTLAAGQDPPPDLVSAIYDETEGNPFFVEEVFQHLREEGKLLDADGGWRRDLRVSDIDVPEGIRLVLGRRLDRLSEDSRKALTTAAVIGRRFSYQLLESASDLGADALLDAVDVAERARLINAADDGAETSFSFAHELIRQTLLANVSLPRRQRLHLRVADAMEPVLGTAAAAHAVELAHHLFLAGEAADSARTAEYMIMAGDQARDAAAFEDALGYFRDALSLSGWSDAKERAQTLAKLGFAQMDTGQWDDAGASLSLAMDELEALGEFEEAAAIAHKRAFLLSWRGQFQESIEVAGRGLAVLGDRDPGKRAALMAFTGAIFAAAGGYDVSMQMVNEAVAIARTIDDPRLLGTVLGYASIAHFWFSDREKVETMGREAASLLRPLGALWDLVNVLAFVELSLLWSGRPDESEAVHVEVAQLAERIGHHGAQMCDLRCLNVRAQASGDLDLAERLSQEDVRLCLDTGMPWHRDARLFEASVLFARGDWEGAARTCAEADTWDIPYGNAVLPAAMGAMFCAYLGRRDQALALLNRLAADLPELGQSSHWGSRTLAWCAAETYLVLGETNRLTALYPLLTQLVQDKERGFILRGFDSQVIASIMAAASAAVGDWDEASLYLDQARREAALWGPRSEADADYWEAWIEVRKGTPEARETATRLAGDAATAYRKLGMPRHVELAETLLAQAGSHLRDP